MTKRERIAHLVKERGLHERGFGRALRAVLGDDWDGEFRDVVSLVPAAFAFETPQSDDFWDLHVYEVEGTAEIAEHKLRAYGHLADDSPVRVTLHLIDKYDHELVITNDLLEVMAFNGVYEKSQEGKEFIKANRKRMRSAAVAQHHTVEVTKVVAGKELKSEQAKWKAAYDALREMGVTVD